MYNATGKSRSVNILSVGILVGFPITLDLNENKNPGGCPAKQRKILF